MTRRWCTTTICSLSSGSTWRLSDSLLPIPWSTFTVTSPCVTRRPTSPAASRAVHQAPPAANAEASRQVASSSVLRRHITSFPKGRSGLTPVPPPIKVSRGVGWKRKREPRGTLCQSPTIELVSAHWKGVGRERRSDIFDVTSVGQRSSPLPRNSIASSARLSHNLGCDKFIELSSRLVLRLTNITLENCSFEFVILCSNR